MTSMDPTHYSKIYLRYFHEPTVDFFFFTLSFQFFITRCEFIQRMHQFLSTGLKPFTFTLNEDTQKYKVPYFNKGL